MEEYLINLNKKLIDNLDELKKHDTDRKNKEKIINNVNEKIREFNLETTFTCPTCKTVLNDIISLNDHILVYHDKEFNNIPELEDDESDSDIESRRPEPKRPNLSDDEEMFECIICKNRYEREDLLGAHFSNSHRDYATMLELDKRILKKGYPGLDILEHIGMIKKTTGNTDECKICCHEYQKNEKTKKHIMDDSTIMLGKKEDINKKSIPKESILLESHDDICIHIPKMRKNITITDDRIKFRDRKAIELCCCGENICTICLEMTLTENQNITCPYCFRDHTIKDDEYVKIYEIGDMNKKAWEKWWRSKLDIMY